jgi:hypothetical protein
MKRRSQSEHDGYKISKDPDEWAVKGCHEHCTTVRANLSIPGNNVADAQRAAADIDLE